MNYSMICPACGGKKEYFILVCAPCFKNRHVKPEVMEILEEAKEIEIAA